MSLLLNHRDIDVNIRDSSDDTALNWAIDKEHKEIVRMIFGHGQVEKLKKMLIIIIIIITGRWRSPRRCGRKPGSTCCRTRPPRRR